MAITSPKTTKTGNINVVAKIRVTTKYLKGLVKNNDTLHLFVNHWPSRWGGQLDSENRRMEAAKVLRAEVDSIFNANPGAKIVIMGDFNDYPENKSITNILKAQTSFNNLASNELYNLSAYVQKTKKVGSHKYEGEWGILDQIIVSGALLIAENGIVTAKEKADVFYADFLLVDDEMYTGKKNFRTYMGFKYLGGYSDHLPVLLDFDYVK